MPASAVVQAVVVPTDEVVLSTCAEGTTEHCVLCTFRY